MCLRHLTVKLAPGAVIAALVLLAPLAGAQERTQTRPRVGPHTFVPLTLSTDPFVSTAFQLSLGYSSSVWTRILRYPARLDSVEVDASVLYMRGGLGFQYAPVEWACLRGEFNGLTRFGSDAVSILQRGISASSGTRLGWLFRLAETDRSYVSTYAGLFNSSVTSIDMRRAVADSSAAGVPDSLVANSNPLGGVVALSYARAFDSFVGAVGWAEFSYGDAIVPGEASNGAMKILLSLDLGARWGIPIGIGAQYGFTTAPVTLEDPDGLAHGFELRASYTGRPDFSLTVSTGVQIVPLSEPEPTFYYHETQATLNYYF